MSRSRHRAPYLGIAIMTLFVAIQAASKPRCLQFTWLGSSITNESNYENATCDDATKGYKGTPCVEPLVVTNDGSWPNVKYLWKNHPNASCILSPNHVCAQYTYYFNGHAENSTYFCAKAVSDKRMALTDGCYEHVNGSYATKVCICRTTPGSNEPCNYGFIPAANWLFIIIFTIVLII